MKQKQKQTPTPAPRRVKIGQDFDKRARICSEMSDFCQFANSHIIPALEALEIEVTLPAVISYTQNPEAMRAEYIAREMQAVNNPVLDEIIRTKIAEEFNAIVTLPPAGERTSHPDFLRLEEDTDRAEQQEELTPAGVTPQRLTYDVEAVIADADIYITDPAQLDAYDRHQKAVEAMNEFFNGAAPEAWEEPLYNYFVPDKDRPGYMKAAEMHSYTRFIK